MDKQADKQIRKIVKDHRKYYNFHRHKEICENSDRQKEADIDK